ncbi:MAG: zinc ABC transporter substrate-binding protein [Planctomycetes bacterium]|nr:zinc ABC transporter substrate-binding protein [Planctomycetota bacterium]
MRPILLLVFAAVLAAADNAPLKVVCTTTILADLARQVGGGRVEVVSLLKPGADPHTFQPSPDDVRLIASARLVVVNGLGYEGWLDQLISAAGVSRERVVIASTGVEPMTAGAHAHADGHDHGGDQDPHAWHDAKNGMRYVANLRDAFTAADAAGTGDYAAWCDLYQAQLRVIDAWMKKQIATLPSERRVLVTSHDAMAYFARAYGLEVVPVEGITTGQEPDPARFAKLITLLRTRGVPAVFIESSANPKVVERLGTEAGARLGGVLLADSLDLPGQLGDSYLGMFAHNARTIVSALK